MHDKMFMIKRVLLYDITKKGLISVSETSDFHYELPGPQRRHHWCCYCKAYAIRMRNHDKDLVIMCSARRIDCKEQRWTGHARLAGLSRNGTIVTR